jgi:tetratricopeptide (TPR) repeat protein
MGRDRWTTSQDGITATVDRFDRLDVLRILRITNRQMQSWQKAGLVPVSDVFSFADLLQIKKLRDLRADRVGSSVIRKSLEGMKIAAGMSNPLVEAGVTTRGKRLMFRHQGAVVDPMSGQFLLDFADRGNNLVVATAKVQPISVPQPETVAQMFARGVALEENPETQHEAISTYLKVLEIEPLHAPAHINLGTLHYNRGDFARAEQYYRQAIDADPKYALAYFDLGNVLDETGRLKDAVQSYLMAIALAPTYADAHYNVALAFEKMRMPRRALAHWRAYVKLDSAGPWNKHARQQIAKILREEKLQVVFRRVR